MAHQEIISLPSCCPPAIHHTLMHFPEAVNIYIRFILLGLKPKQHKKYEGNDSLEPFTGR
jgi:hypothetical protein